MCIRDSFIAEVIFFVFFTELTRSRSSRIVAPMVTSATRATSVEAAAGATAGRATVGAWKAAAELKAQRATNLNIAGCGQSKRTQHE